MKNLLVITISILFISCGGGNNSGTPTSQVNCIDNVSKGNSGKPGNLDLQILNWTEDSLGSIPVAGVVVQLDHDGVCVKSNADGFVTFSAVSNGEHDIHIFSPEGYTWRSLYNINTGRLYEFHISKINQINTVPKSYISFKGAVKNNLIGNLYSIYFITDTGKKYIGRKIDTSLNTATNYAVDFEFSLPVGTIIKGDLIAFEHQYDSNSSESVLVDSATTKLPSLTFITKATTGNYTSNNNANNISFSAIVSKPIASTLLTLNDVVVPEQLHLYYLDIRGYKNTITQSLLKPTVKFFGFNNINKNLVFPRVFNSVDPFNFTEVDLFMIATASNTFDNLWTYYSKYSKNSPAFTFKPQITRLPAIQDNQTGSLISWNNIPQNLTSQYLRIGRKENKLLQTSWLISLDSRATSVRLPKIPNGIKSVLSTGKSYELSLNGWIENQSFETFRVYNKTWKP